MATLVAGNYIKVSETYTGYEYETRRSKIYNMETLVKLRDHFS